MLPNRKNIRLCNYDYSSNGLYFVTICAQRHSCFFGHIANSVIDYTPIGKQAELLWRDIVIHHHNVELGRFVVMPNHIHGIIRIVGDDELPILIPELYSLNAFKKSIPGSLSAIVGQYKAALTRWCNANHHSYFGWQTRFYDHIIRNRDEYYQIDNYIASNVANCDIDKLYRV